MFCAKSASLYSRFSVVIFAPVVRCKLVQLSLFTCPSRDVLVLKKTYNTFCILKNTVDMLALSADPLKMQIFSRIDVTGISASREMGLKR